MNIHFFPIPNPSVTAWLRKRLPPSASFRFVSVFQSGLASERVLSLRIDSNRDRKSDRIDSHPLDSGSNETVFFLRVNHSIPLSISITNNRRSMNIFNLFDAPSLFIIGLPLIAIGILVGKKNATTHILIDQLALPIGCTSLLIGFIKILTNMSDPTAFGPAFAVALLPILYCAIIYTINRVFFTPNPEPIESKNEKEKTSNVHSFIACFLFLTTTVVAMAWNGRHELLSFIDLPFMIIFLGSTMILSVLEAKMKKLPFAIPLRKNSAFMALILSLIGVVFLMTELSDPSNVGPAMTIVFLGILYGFIGYIIGTIFTFSTPNSVRHYENQSQVILLLLTALFGLFKLIMVLLAF